MNKGFGIFETIQGSRAIINDSWTQSAENFLERGDFTSADFHGNFGDLSFFENCGSTLRDISVENKDKLLSGILHLNNLEILSLKFLNKDNISFHNLPKLLDLEFIWSTKEQDFTALSHPKLKYLRIDKFPRIQFENNSVLESLFLYSPKFDCSTSLQALTKLRTLKIENARKLVSIENLPETITSLDFRYCGKVSNFSGLDQLQNLAQIYFRNSCNSENIPKEIFRLPSLKSLAIVGTPLFIDWEKVLSIPNLERLFLVDANSALSNEDLITISKHKGKTVKRIDRQGKKTPLISLEFTSSD